MSAGLSSERSEFYVIGEVRTRKESGVMVVEIERWMEVDIPRDGTEMNGKMHNMLISLPSHNFRTVPSNPRCGT